MIKKFAPQMVLCIYPNWKIPTLQVLVPYANDLPEGISARCAAATILIQNNDIFIAKRNFKIEASWLQWSPFGVTETFSPALWFLSPVLALFSTTKQIGRMRDG